METDQEDVIYRAQLRAMREVDEEARLRRARGLFIALIIAVLIGIVIAALLPDYLRQREFDKAIERIHNNTGYYR